MPTPEHTLQRLLHNPPFPWQRRLLSEMLTGRTRSSLDLPTGLGKTSILAIWLTARMHGAPLPRRLIYIVDRRAVVDQATTEAEQLRRAVGEDAELAEALGLEEGQELPISTLRGQHVDNRAWLADPTVPAIVVGTVDMIGSRLLFNAYAAGRGMRPFFAGALGHDTLFVLDESHLVPPFHRLLEQFVARPLSTEPHLTLPPARLVALSATGRADDEPFQLDDDDRAHPEVARRIEAEKRVVVDELRRGVKLHDALAQAAWKLANEGTVPTRVLVYVNRRDNAERTAKTIQSLARKARTPSKVVLFVGGRRVFERRAAEEELHAAGLLAGSERIDEPVFVVATSAGEVGIDLDADHMVGDIVSWERMIQRLGRVNRRGRGAAQVRLVYEPPETKPSPLDERRVASRELIGLLPSNDAGYDASPHALDGLSKAHPVARTAATTPEPSYPALLDETVESWSMTSLPEHTGRPEIAPWLRGWVDDPPQTTVIWREHVPRAGTPQDQVDAWFHATPPHLSETLELPSPQVAKWLAERVKRTSLQDPDQPVVFVLGFRRSSTTAIRHDQLMGRSWQALERLLSGRTVVLASSVGGLAESGLLDPKRGEPATVATDRPFSVERVAASAPLDEGRPLLYRLAAEGPPDAPTAWLIAYGSSREAVHEDSRSTTRRAQLLGEHHDWSAAEARRIVDRLGLPEDFGALVVLAATLHDEGKRARRWQAAFSAPADGDYAKTRGPLSVHALGGYRHEFGSLLRAMNDERVAALDPLDRDLVLHLIASHHGNARPLLTSRGCEDAPPSRLQADERAVVERFLSLQDRWGPWRLAYLEMLLRAADQRASRRLEES
jgi:CRISPR-associated endonuclease/helicase Cas3